MEVSQEEIWNTKAVFSDGDKNFLVDKYIQNGNILYTCCTGRSTNIRNIKKTKVSNFSFKVNEEHTICVLEKELLTKIESHGTIENLQKIVFEQNSKKKPAPKQVFPPSFIDFHWKEISELEKYNPYTWNRRNIDLHK